MENRGYAQVDISLPHLPPNQRLVFHIHKNRQEGVFNKIVSAYSQMYTAAYIPTFSDCNNAYSTNIAEKHDKTNWPKGTCYGSRYVFDEPNTIGWLDFITPEPPDKIKDHLRAEFEQFVFQQGKSLQIKNLPPNILIKIRFEIKGFTGDEGFAIHKSETAKNDPVFLEKGEFDGIIVDGQSKLFCEFFLKHFKDGDTKVILRALEWTIPD